MRRSKQILALALVFVLVLGMVPTTVMAEETEGPSYTELARIPMDENWQCAQWAYNDRLTIWNNEESYSFMLAYDHQNKVIQQLPNSQWRYIDDFNENGYAIAMNDDNEYGVIDHRGNVVVPFGTYYLYGSINQDNKTWASTKEKDDFGDDVYRYYLLNVATGERREVSFEMYQAATGGCSVNGLVRKKEEDGYYYALESSLSTDDSYISLNAEPYYTATDFSYGYAIVQKTEEDGDLRYIINTRNQVVGSFTCEYVIGGFNKEGYLHVEGSFDYCIDTTGKKVTPELVYVQSFSHGYAIKNNASASSPMSQGMVDIKTGETIIPLGVYEQVLPATEMGLAWALTADNYLAVIALPNYEPPADSGEGGEGSELPPLDPATGTAAITTRVPEVGATDVGYDASKVPQFQITFDRDILGVTMSNNWIYPIFDFTKEPFRIYQASTGSMVFEVTEDDWLEVEDASSDCGVKEGVTLSIVPANPHTLLQPGTAYFITMGEGFVRMADGTGSPAIEEEDWTFCTEGVATETATVSQVTIKAADGVSATVTVPWNDGWFVKTATVYQHDLAETSIALSSAAYVEDTTGEPIDTAIREALDSLGFSGLETYNYGYLHTMADNDVVAYTFGLKYIIDEIGGKIPLVAIVIKGTSADEEWYSDFKVGTGRDHLGFQLAKEDLMENLTTYLEGWGISQAKFLVTGHSRGAAVANMVAADLNYSSWSNPKNVYGYTFATPAVSMNAGKTGYENIFNIISSEDFVPQVPLVRWGFKRYGVDRFLPTRSYYTGDYYDVYIRMKTRYQELSGEEHARYKQSVLEVQNVVGEFYKLAKNTTEYYNRLHQWGFGDDRISLFSYAHLLCAVLVEQFSAESLVNLGTTVAGDFTEITGYFANAGLFGTFISAHSQCTYYSWINTCTEAELFNNGETMTTVTLKCAVEEQVEPPVPAEPAPVALALEEAETEAPALCANVFVTDSKGVTVASVVDGMITVDDLDIFLRDDRVFIGLPADGEYTIDLVATAPGAVTWTVEEQEQENGAVNTLRTVIMEDIALGVKDTLVGTVLSATEEGSAAYMVEKDGVSIKPTFDSSTNVESVPEHETDAYSVACGGVTYKHCPDCGNWITEDGTQITTLPEVPSQLLAEGVKVKLTIAAYEESGRFLGMWSQESGEFAVPETLRSAKRYQVFFLDGDQCPTTASLPIEVY